MPRLWKRQEEYTADFHVLFYHLFLVKEEVVKQKKICLLLSATFSSIENDWLKLIPEYHMSTACGKRRGGKTSQTILSTLFYHSSFAIERYLTHHQMMSFVPITYLWEHLKASSIALRVEVKQNKNTVVKQSLKPMVKQSTNPMVKQSTNTVVKQNKDSIVKQSMNIMIIQRKK